MLPFALVFAAENINVGIFHTIAKCFSLKTNGRFHRLCPQLSPFLCVPAGCRRRVLSGGALGCCWLSAEWARPYLSTDKQTFGQSKSAVTRQVVVLHLRSKSSIDSLMVS